MTTAFMTLSAQTVLLSAVQLEAGAHVCCQAWRGMVDGMSEVFCSTEKVRLLCFCQVCHGTNGAKRFANKKPQNSSHQQCLQNS
jgi:cytochrome c553